MEAATRTAASEKPKLKLVEVSTDPNVNVFLYGEPKSGKTVGAASAPKPLLYLNADRTNATRMAHTMYDFDEVVVDSLDTLITATQVLQEGEYRTVVVDPIADVYRILLEEVSNRVLSPSLPNYGDTGTHLERFCRHLCELPVNVVLVAHQIDVDTEEEGIAHLPYVSTKSGSPVFAAKLLAMVDVIGYVGVIEGEDEAGPKYVAQLRSGKGRRGGDRFGVLGDLRELDLTEWVELAKKATAPKAAKTKGAA